MPLSLVIPWTDFYLHVNFEGYNFFTFTPGTAPAEHLTVKKGRKGVLTLLPSEGDIQKYWTAVAEVEKR